MQSHRVANFGGNPAKGKLISPSSMEENAMSPASKDQTETMLDAGATAAGKPDVRELVKKTGPVGKVANEAPLNHGKPTLDKPATRSR
jgi:hypothetical protein